MQRLSWRIDFFSLSCLLKDLWSVASDLHGAQQLKNDHRHGLLASRQTPQPNYSPTYQPIYQPAKLAELGRAVDLIEQLCTDFAAHDNELGSSHTNTPLSTELPHQNYIHTIDQVLSSSGLAVDWARGLPYKLFETYRAGHRGVPERGLVLRPQRGPTEMLQQKLKTEPTHVLQVPVDRIARLVKKVVQIPPSFNSYKSGQTFRDHPKAPPMVVIPPSNFSTGTSISEKTPTNAAFQSSTFLNSPTKDDVNASPTFAISQAPVTVEQFKHFINGSRRFDLPNGYCTDNEYYDGESSVIVNRRYVFKYDASWRRPYFAQSGQHPVVLVSWNDAQAYLAWLNQLTRYRFDYRLPSGAEWEFAARAGSTTAFHTGDQLTPVHANIIDGRDWPVHNGYGLRRGTCPVGTYPPNNFGLYDIHGNVSEITSDSCVPSANGELPDGSRETGAPRDMRFYAVRSSSYLSFASDSEFTRCSWAPPTYANIEIGFRIVRTLNC